jgi:dihydroorotase
LQGIQDGTIDIVATDHAPHSKEEKSCGLQHSAFGISGLETAFPVLYTKLVLNKIITLEKLVELLHTNPNRRFNIGTPLKVGEKANLTVFDLDNEYKINSNEFYSLGKSTPFEGMRVLGKCKMTMVNGGKYIYD